MSVEIRETTNAEIQSALLPGYLMCLAEGGQSQGNCEAHARALGRFAEYMAPRAIDEATPADLEGFKAWLQEFGVSESSLAVYTHVLASWQKHLSANGALATAEPTPGQHVDDATPCLDGFAPSAVETAQRVAPLSPVSRACRPCVFPGNTIQGSSRTISRVCTCPSAQ